MKYCDVSTEYYIYRWLICCFVDITVMTNILQGIIKILNEKILKAINLNWFQNNASAKTNSLNGHSNESWINE